MNDGPDTLKIPRVEQLNELEYAEYRYNAAMKTYINSPTYANRDAFLKANEHYMNVRYAYSKGGELLRAYKAQNAVSFPLRAM